MPGGSDQDATIQRFKSSGHHTEGFDTLAKALEFIKQQDDWVATGHVYDWDGTGIPAMVEWFEHNEHCL